MSIFGDIMHKIVGAAESVMGGGAAPTPIGAIAGQSIDIAAAAPATLDVPAAVSVDAPTANATAPQPVPAQPVDVGAVLAQMASQKGGGGNYKSSIVDLLKLLDLDSSLNARKQLAGELNVHVGADGTAEENIALHHAVMAKIEENGGTVPADMKG